VPQLFLTAVFERQPLRAYCQIWLKQNVSFCEVVVVSRCDWLAFKVPKTADLSFLSKSGCMLHRPASREELRFKLTKKSRAGLESFLLKKNATWYSNLHALLCAQLSQTFFYWPSLFAFTCVCSSFKSRHCGLSATRLFLSSFVSFQRWTFCIFVCPLETKRCVLT